MSNEKLKPCPFCGSTDIVITQNNGFLSGGYAMCRGCSATTRSSIYTDEAVANWNRRTYNGHKCSECSEGSAENDRDQQAHT